MLDNIENKLNRNYNPNVILKYQLTPIQIVIHFIIESNQIYLYSQMKQEEPLLAKIKQIIQLCKTKQSQTTSILY